MQNVQHTKPQPGVCKHPERFIQHPSREIPAALALVGPCRLPSAMLAPQASPAHHLISPSLRGICASSRSPNEACTQAALYSAASRCSRVGAVPSACSHSRRAPMRSPPSYLARPALSSCSACDVQDGSGACVCGGASAAGSTGHAAATGAKGCTLNTLPRLPSPPLMRDMAPVGGAALHEESSSG